MTARRCSRFDGRPRKLSFFEWQPPEGVTYTQHFRRSHVDSATGRPVVEVTFSASCECGRSVAPRASRADALQDLTMKHPEKGSKR